ncbi:MAG: HEAT repeat domain-containing protein [Planctomycetota bacterium]
MIRALFFLVIGVALGVGGYLAYQSPAARAKVRGWFGGAGAAPAVEASSPAARPATDVKTPPTVTPDTPIAYPSAAAMAAIRKLASTKPEERIAGLQELRRLREPAGVPFLLDRLRDDDWRVRHAANEALKGVARQDFKFDPQGPAAERETVARTWEAWWKKSRYAP